MNDALWFLFFTAWPLAAGGLLFLFARRLRAGAPRAEGSARGRAEPQPGRLRSPSAPPPVGIGRAVRLVTGNLLVFLFLATLLFWVGEVYYRFIYDSTDSFGYTKVSRRWVARHVQRNAQGVRDSVDYQTDIPPGRRRITFLGDSFTEGHGIKRLADRFADRIQRARPDWEVHAVAESGAETGRHLELLQALAGYEYQFDQVVLVYGLNDLSDIVPEWNTVYERIYADSRNQNWLLRQSYLANLLYYRLKARRDPDIVNYYHFLLPAYRGPLWEQQKNRLRAMHDFVAGRGGQLRVVLFPFLHRPLDETYEFRFVHEALADFWRELNVPCLDLLRVYQGHPPRALVVNRFDAHPNEFAHKLAADAIEKFLAQHLQPRPAR